MAQQTRIILTDDLDGSEATQTVRFAYQGTSYEIDLNDEHAASIAESFAEWADAARKVPARGTTTGSGRSSAPRASSSPKRTDLDDVRVWARANGHQVYRPRPRRQQGLDAYDAAH